VPPIPLMSVASKPALKASATLRYHGTA
jgi:hypothetical protein